MGPPGAHSGWIVFSSFCVAAGGGAVAGPVFVSSAAALAAMTVTTSAAEVAVASAAARASGVREVVVLDVDGRVADVMSLHTEVMAADRLPPQGPAIPGWYLDPTGR